MEIAIKRSLNTHAHMDTKRIHTIPVCAYMTKQVFVDVALMCSYVAVSIHMPAASE